MKKQTSFCMTGFLTVAISIVMMAITLSCAPKTVKLDFNNLPDTEHCQYMKDVCKEAENFQARFEAMSKEEQEDAKVILNAYIQQCEGAQALCKQTM
jgi:hypothetical protein